MSEQPFVVSLFPSLALQFCAGSVPPVKSWCFRTSLENLLKWFVCVEYLGGLAQLDSAVCNRRFRLSLIMTIYFAWCCCSTITIRGT